MMKKGNVMLAVGLFCLIASARMMAQTDVVPAYSGTLRLTLDRAIEIALDENPTIRIAEEDIRLKEMTKLETTLGLLPEANLSGSYQRTIEKQTMVMNNMQFKVGVNNMYSGGLSISLPVFAPALYKSMNLTRTDVELAVESARASKQDLVCQVTKAFYQLMLAQDSYEVLQKALAQSEENYRIVSAKYDEGRVSEYDKISAEVQMRNLQPSVISARNAVDLSKLQLKVLMGVTADVDIEVEGNLKDYEEGMYATMIGSDSLSLRNNSSLLQLDLNSRLLKNTLDIQNQSFLPNVALQFNYMYTCMADNFDFQSYNWNPYANVALSVSIPLFKYSNFSTVKKTRVQMNQLQMNRDYAERQLEMQKNTYLKNMTACAEQVSSNKEAIIQAQKGRDIAQTLYDVGRGTVLELNSAEVALTQSELTYSQSVYDWLTAKADLDKLLGRDYITEK
ncbi:MAG: TolC family protein [Bacteroidaceae bacterium]|nr:TolC family protein [Bacteroidaceae bacterium]